MNSIIADTLTRIRNGQMASKKIVSVKFSKKIVYILGVLRDEGYIDGFDDAPSAESPYEIRVALKYYKNKAVIKKIKMISKPGCKVYSGCADMPYSFNGLGVVIVSTSKGVMSDSSARELGLGGELICEVY